MDIYAYTHMYIYNPFIAVFSSDVGKTEIGGVDTSLAILDSFDHVCPVVVVKFHPTSPSFHIAT